MSDKERFATALESFYYPQDEDHLAGPIIAAISQLPSPFVSLAQAFEVSLKAATTVASMPFAMTVIRVQERQFQAFLMAQRIRSLKSTQHFSSEAEREEWVLRTAREKLAAERNESNRDLPTS
jgi:hypothetical protein